MRSVFNGFAAEFRSDDNGSWHLPVNANPQPWCEHIQSCLKTASENELMVEGLLSPASEALLEEASIDHEEQQLSQISSQPPLVRRKESLDG